MLTLLKIILPSSAKDRSTDRNRLVVYSMFFSLKALNYVLNPNYLTCMYVITKCTQVVRRRSLPKIHDHSASQRVGPMAAGRRLHHLVRPQHALLPVRRPAVHDGTGNMGLHSRQGQLDHRPYGRRPQHLRGKRRVDDYQAHRSQ